MTTKKKGRPKKVAEVDLSTWSILIPWETRIAVKKAAERSKMGINAWIDKVLIKEAQEVLTGKKEIAKPEDVRDVLSEEVLKKLGDIDKRLNELDWRPSWIKKIVGKRNS